MNKKIRRQIGACHTIQQGWSESLCQIWLYLRVFARQRYSCILRLSLNVKILDLYESNEGNKRMGRETWERWNSHKIDFVLKCLQFGYTKLLQRYALCVILVDTL